MINDWLTTTFHTEQKVVFPYGNKYPCGDGGWIHYRVICQEHYEDIKKLLAVKGL